MNERTTNWLEEANWDLDFYKRYKDKMEKLKEQGLKRDPPVWILPENMSLD